MNKGVTLLSLMITIVVIIILAGIAIFSANSTMDEADKVKKEAEFNEVATYIGEISTRVNAGLMEIDLSSLTPATTELDLFPISKTGFRDDMKTAISNANAESDREANFKYYYITGKQIQDGNIPGVTVDSEGKLINDSDKYFTVPKKVANDYIINFIDGTVIGKISDTESLVRGYKD